MTFQQQAARDSWHQFPRANSVRLFLALCSVTPVDGTTSAPVGVFTWWELANATNGRSSFLCFLESSPVNTY